jgi:hypothetical protein
MLMVGGSTDIPRAVTQGHRAHRARPAGRRPDRCGAGGTRQQDARRLRQHTCQPLEPPAHRMPLRLPAPLPLTSPASRASIAAATLPGTIP